MPAVVLVGVVDAEQSADAAVVVLLESECERVIERVVEVRDGLRGVPGVDGDVEGVLEPFELLGCRPGGGPSPSRGGLSTGFARGSPTGISRGTGRSTGGPWVRLG